MKMLSDSPAVWDSSAMFGGKTVATRATVLGTGSYLPANVIDNQYFSETLGLDTTADWIESRTGICRRRFASAGEKTSDMAVLAAQQALAQAGLPATEVDLIVLATSTPDYTMPATACLVQERLGASRAMAFDISNACAGFVYALDVAVRYLQTNTRHALVIGADLGSSLVDRHDRTTSIFFADGAGAVLLSSSGEGRILATQLHSQGNTVALSVPVGGTMTMDGKAIWNFATAVLPETVRQLCAAAHMQPADLQLIIPHQANRNIIRHAALELGLPEERMMVNLDRYGNTLAASIPIAMDEALRQGRAAHDDTIALVGFGAGLAWGGLLMQL